MKLQRHKQSRVTGDADTDVLQLHMEECLGLSETGRGKKKKKSTQRTRRKHGPANTLILNFKLPEMLENKILLYSHCICGFCYGTPGVIHYPLGCIFSHQLDKCKDPVGNGIAEPLVGKSLDH